MFNSIYYQFESNYFGWEDYNQLAWLRIGKYYYPNIIDIDTTWQDYVLTRYHKDYPPSILFDLFKENFESIENNYKNNNEICYYWKENDELYAFLTNNPITFLKKDFHKLLLGSDWFQQEINKYDNIKISEVIELMIQFANSYQYPIGYLSYPFIQSLIFNEPEDVYYRDRYQELLFEDHASLGNKPEKLKEYNSHNHYVYSYDNNQLLKIIYFDKINKFFFITNNIYDVFTNIAWNRIDDNDKNDTKLKSEILPVQVKDIDIDYLKVLRDTYF